MTTASSRPEWAMRPGARIPYSGDYELLEEIGRGSTGVVYRARQLSLNRIVALKMTHVDEPISDAECCCPPIPAQLAARLRHPNLVAIYEVGEHEGQRFCAMEHIDGQSLAHLADRHSLPAKRVARWVEIIAEAIHYTHQRGIVHGNLTPSSVLIDAADQPHITGFGLAERPNELSPEQAAGRDDLVGPHRDIYALGAILYEFLTGEPPSHAQRHVGVEEREPPRALNPRVDRDLERICLNCLEKNPQRRYRSARAVAEDLELWLVGQPILGRSATAWEKSVRWIRQRAAKLLLSGLALVLTILLLYGLAFRAFGFQPVYFFNGLAPLIDRTAVIYLAVVLLLGLAGLVVGSRVWLRNPVLVCGGWLLIVASCAAPVYRWAANPQIQRLQLNGFTGHLRYAPDNTLLAGLGDGTILRYDAGAKEVRTRITTSLAGVERLAVSRDGSRLALQRTRGVLELVELPSGRSIRIIAVPGYKVLMGVFSDDSQRLAVFVNAEYAEAEQKWRIPEEGNLRIYSAIDGQLLSVERTPVASEAWQALDWKRNVIAMAEVYEPGRGILLWDSDQHRRLHTLVHPEHQSGPLSVALSPDASTVAVGYAPYDVALWDVRSGKRLHDLISQNNWVVCLDFSPDGTLLASGEGNSAVRVWDVKTGAQRYHFGMGSQTSSQYTYSVSFDSTGHRLACGSEAGTIVIWKVH